MDNLAGNLVYLLQYLLPGFLSAWVFYGFTSFVKPNQFERVVQALIFTLIIQVLIFFYKSVTIFFSNYISFGNWNSSTELASSVFLATILGFVFAFFANNDKFHSLIRFVGISSETSYPSEWFGEFSKRVTYVVLHLKGERRIYGWPREWPSSSEKGHFALEQASWLDSENLETPLTGVQSIIIPVKDVEMVEFMENTWSSK